MDLLDILFASYQEASAFEDIEENEGKRNKERSQRWVNSLGKQFQGLFPIESGFRVFYLGNDDNKTDFGLNELLFDISVCEVGTVRSAFHESELIFVRGAVWQVESEFSRDSHQSIIDFNKLNMGNALHKLFIGPIVSNNADFIEVLRKPAGSCSGDVYVALVPHPGEWDMKDESDIQLYKYEDEKWHLVKE